MCERHVPSGEEGREVVRWRAALLSSALLSSEEQTCAKVQSETNAGSTYQNTELPPTCAMNNGYAGLLLFDPPEQHRTAATPFSGCIGLRAVLDVSHPAENIESDTHGHVALCPVCSREHTKVGVPPRNIINCQGPRTAIPCTNKCRSTEDSLPRRESSKSHQETAANSTNRVYTEESCSFRGGEMCVSEA